MLGDDCRTNLVGVVESGGVVIDQRDLGVNVTQLSSFAEDPSGELYALSLTGTIYELTQGGTTSTSTSTTTTTAPASGCPCTLFGTTAPAVADSGDANANVELGVRFTSDTSGSVIGVRFYKSAANTGTHTGSLWTNTGTLLATGTFTNETATGWQTLLFNTPVGITAGTTYVASYHTTAGHYAATHNEFATAYNNPPLHAPRERSQRQWRLPIRHQRLPQPDLPRIQLLGRPRDHYLDGHDDNVDNVDNVDEHDDDYRSRERLSLHAVRYHCTRGRR